MSFIVGSYSEGDLGHMNKCQDCRLEAEKQSNPDTLSKISPHLLTSDSFFFFLIREHFLHVFDGRREGGKNSWSLISFFLK